MSELVGLATAVPVNGLVIDADLGLETIEVGVDCFSQGSFVIWRVEVRHGDEVLHARLFASEVEARAFAREMISSLYREDW